MPRGCEPTVEPAQTNLYGAHGCDDRERAPHDWLETLRVAWVTDPDGHPVELVQKRG
jgi:hypothetical protein